VDVAPARWLLSRLAGVLLAGMACGPGAIEDLTRGRADGGGAGSDGGRTDAGRSDARADGGCIATFCDDFDDGILGGRWSDSGATSGAVIELVEGGVSAPLAFRAASPGGIANTQALLAKFIGRRRAVRCELDLQIVAPSASGEVDYLSFVSRTADVSLYQVYFAVFDGTWNVAEFARGADGGRILDRAKDMPAPPVNRWTHVVFETDGNEASISFDGTKVATLSALSAIPPDGREIQIGITFASSASTASSALYDNVACDYGL
jgi:hypothetical protein